MVNRVRVGPSGCRTGRWIWSTPIPTAILMPEIPLPPNRLLHRHRMDAWGMSTWFMCTIPEAAGKLIAMDYDNLAVQETTIVG